MNRDDPRDSPINTPEEMSGDSLDDLPEEFQKVVAKAMALLYCINATRRLPLAKLHLMVVGIKEDDTEMPVLSMGIRVESLEEYHAGEDLKKPPTNQQH